MTARRGYILPVYRCQMSSSTPLHKKTSGISVQLVHGISVVTGKCSIVHYLKYLYNFLVEVNY